MGKMFVFKGMNGFMPRGIDWSSKSVYHYDFKFNDNCIYNFEDEDKYDWNKLMGISYNFSHNRENVLMIGWRYMDGGFELSPYIYKNGRRITYNPIIKVLPNEWFSCKIEKGDVYDGYTSVRLHISRNEEHAYFLDHFEKINKSGKTREIHPWFGGSKSAPHYMSICRVKK